MGFYDTPRLAAKVTIKSYRGIGNAGLLLEGPSDGFTIGWQGCGFDD